MSMFRRRMPSDTGHEQHDPLLIAQYAARDPLDRGQAQEAAELVASCHECASLAADLGAIERAVAAEPMPPRQRDFTLSLEQAERLRGSMLDRFMRRLALPRSRALRPVAAGVMSLGLLLVVAGNVILQAQEEAAGVVPGASRPGQSEVVVAPSFMAGVEPGLGDVVAEPDDGAAPRAPAERSRLPDATRGPEPAAGFDNAEVSDLAGAIESADAIESVDERAGSELETPRDADAAAALDVLEADALELQRNSALESSGDGLGISAPTTQDATDEFADSAVETAPLFREEERTEAFKSRANEPGATDDERDDVVSQSVVGDVAQDPKEPEGTARSELAPGTDTDAAVDLVVFIGVILAVGGFLFLLLIWLARRRNPDPLAP